MRLMFTRSHDGTGRDRRYALNCVMEIASAERELLIEYAPPSLFQKASPVFTLLNDGQLVKYFTEPDGAYQLEGAIRRACEDAATYIALAQGFDGSNQVEISLS